MKELFYVFKDRKCLLRMVISGVVFLLAAAPFKLLLTLIPGVTEVRPANMIPVVLGLLWGPAGAWGIAIANAISDVVFSHSPVMVWLPGMVINFFYAYLPYKLWYSLGNREKKSTPPRLESVKEILQFVYVCLIDSLVTTTLLALLFEWLGFQSFSSSVLLLFFNNFDFAIVLGVPVILILTNSKRVGIWTPIELTQDGKNKESRKLWYFDGLLYGISIVGIGYYAASLAGGLIFPKGFEAVLLVLFGVFLIFYILKPMNPEEKNEDQMELSGISIRAKVIIGFLILAVFFVLIIGTATYFSMRSKNGDMKDTWLYIYLVVGISLNILFLVSVLFLRYVEQNITAPLEILSKLAKRFAGRDHQNAEDNQQFSEACRSIDTGDEIGALSVSFRHMMADISSYVDNLARVTAEKERIGAELTVATQIQASMLPCIFPAFPEREEFDIYATMEPAKEVGGDFYDFFMVDNDHLAVVMADVSGKGVPAALFMVIAKTLIKNHAQNGDSGADVFTNVNRQLCENNEAGLFVTAWMGILQISTGDFIYVNAGHNPPLLRRAGENFEYLRGRSGFVLAGMEDMKYRQADMKLLPGDMLYLYTDGVTEATDIHEELYGEQRLKEYLNKNEELPLPEILHGIKADIDVFVKGAPQFDDITMLILKLNDTGIR